MVWYLLITVTNGRLYNSKSKMEKSLLKSPHISLSIPFIFYLKFKQGRVRKGTGGRPWVFSFAQPASWIFRLGMLPRAGARSLAGQSKAGPGDFKKRYIGEKEVHWGVGLERRSTRQDTEIPFVALWGTVRFRYLHFVAFVCYFVPFLIFCILY